MRITERMMVDNSTQQINQNMERLAAAQEKISSGKQFQVISDDPATASLALNLRSSIQVSQSYIDTANVTNEWMSANDYSLNQISDLGTKATSLAESALSDTNGPDQRQAFANQIDGILQNAIDIANTYHGGRYIYGGFQVTKAPFKATMGAGNTVASVAYQGDNGVISRNIGPAQTVTVNVNGNSTFSGFFQSLIDARDAVLANNNGALQTALGNLHTSLDTIHTADSANGGRQGTVQNALDHLGQMQTEIKSLLSQKEDVNVAEAISQMQSQQNTYQVSLEVGQRAISALSLFDVLK